MLKNVIDFVISRTGLPREAALREINFAWKEIWNSDDLPNSVFEITVKPLDNNARISLPWYVGEMRAVKQTGFGRERVELNTPRPYYHDDVYAQSPFVWRILGTSPLVGSITNATTLNLSFTEPVDVDSVATLIGMNDNGSNVREQIAFQAGDTVKETTNRYTDLQALAKSVVTSTDLKLLSAAGEELAVVPNTEFEARNTILQITDKAFKVCNFCRCFDVLYKRSAPYLYYDETALAYEEVLMAKTMEWISLPKDGQEKKTVLYSEKARTLLTAFNYNERAVEHKMDIGRSKMETLYYGQL